MHRVNRLMVPWVRFRLHMLKTHRRQKAASKIGAFQRSLVQQKRYRVVLNSIINLQAMQRRKAAEAIVEGIRDPYAKLSFKDVKRLISKVRSDLEAAVNDKNFRAAADLEAKM